MRMVEKYLGISRSILSRHSRTRFQESGASEDYIQQQRRTVRAEGWKKPTGSGEEWKRHVREREDLMEHIRWFHDGSHNQTMFTGASCGPGRCQKALDEGTITNPGKQNPTETLTVKSKASDGA